MKRILIFFITSALLFGCNHDLLELEPQGSVFTNNYFQTADQIEDAVIATYDVLGHQLGAGLAWSPYLPLAEILSDDAFAGGQDPGDGADENEFNTFNISTGNEIVQSIWKRNYTGVYRANFTIQKCIESERITEDQRAQFMAEAKFLRAYFYFELVRFFENIPLMLEVPTSIDDGRKPQVDPSVIYDQIGADLIDAIADLPESYDTQVGRATTWAAKALLGRVFLYEDGVYGNGITVNGSTLTSGEVLIELEDVIEDSHHDLLPDYASVFTSAGEYSIENVFEVSYAGLPIGGDWGTEQYIEGNLAAQMMGPRIDNSDIFYRGWSFAIPSHQLYEAMAGDPRRDVAIMTEASLLAESAGVTLNTGAFQHTGYFNGKYTTRKSDRGTVGSPELINTTNYRAIRFADVLLMAAEIGQNATYLNRVRDRVGLGPIAYSDAALFNERRIELAGEGIRYWDVLRRGQSFAQSELTVSGTGPDYTGSASVYEVTFNTTTRGLLPIPQVEIDLSNGVLKQNDGY